jgi:hypothetical protein
VPVDDDGLAMDAQGLLRQLDRLAFPGQIVRPPIGLLKFSISVLRTQYAGKNSNRKETYEVFHQSPFSFLTLK